MRADRMHDRKDDERLLDMLDKLDHGEVGPTVMSQRTGLTKGAIAGLRHRVKAAQDPWPCAARKPENRDGGMPRRWWAS